MLIYIAPFLSDLIAFFTKPGLEWLEEESYSSWMDADPVSGRVVSVAGRFEDSSGSASVSADSAAVGSAGDGSGCSSFSSCPPHSQFQIPNGWLLGALLLVCFSLKNHQLVHSGQPSWFCSCFLVCV